MEKESWVEEGGLISNLMLEVAEVAHCSFKGQLRQFLNHILCASSLGGRHM